MVAPLVEHRQRETGRQLGIVVGCAQSHEIPVGRSVHSVSFHPFNLFSQLAEGFILRDFSLFCKCVAL